jgi:sugar/nucleoside kinase (ribokinase family)
VARVIHTGQALVDLTVEVPTLPGRGQNVMASSASQAAGGAVNILLAAVRQGATCVHAGAIGTGPNGDLIRSALDAEGVTWSAPAITDADTGLCIVMVEASAERTFVTTMQAERRISVGSLASCAPVAGDVVCVTGYSLAVASTRDPLLDWLPTLPDAVQIVLDPGAAFAGLAPEVRVALLAVTDVWTGNQEESTALVGVAGMAEAASAICGLLRCGKVAIVRDGPRGCAVSVGGRTTVVKGFPQTPLDTNGAGDAHTGILVAEHALGTDWIRAATRANAGAAIKVTRRGPATAPTASEIDAFLQSHKRER